jgi:hypothetical protein
VAKIALIGAVVLWDGGDNSGGAGARFLGSNRAGKQGRPPTWRGREGGGNRISGERWQLDCPTPPHLLFHEAVVAGACYLCRSPGRPRISAHADRTAPQPMRLEARVVPPWRPANRRLPYVGACGVGAARRVWTCRPPRPSALLDCAKRARTPRRGTHGEHGDGSAGAGRAGPSLPGRCSGDQDSAPDRSCAHV